MTDPTVSALLLAAGNASRFGGAKQIASFEGIPLVRRAARAALEQGLSLTVVTGAFADEVEAALAGLPATLLHNTDWASGMGGSIGLGFRHLLAGTSAAAIVLLADQPLITDASLHRLVNAWHAAPQAIAAAAYGGSLGPPCLFPRAFYTELATWQGAQGARKLLSREGDRVSAVGMPEAANDIDTLEDLERLLR